MPLANDHEVKGLYKFLLAAALAVCFSSVLTFFLLKYFRKVASCCFFWRKQDKKKTTKTRNTKFKKRSKSELYMQYEVLSHHKPHSQSFSQESLNSFNNSEFKIPGKTKIQAVQPSDSSSTSGYLSILSLSEDDGSIAKAPFLEEHIQPEMQRCSETISQSLDSTQKGFNVSMYASEIKHTLATGSLGKLAFSLQYENTAKHKLLVSFHKVLNLQLTRFIENVVGIRLQAMLLPDRLVKCQSEIIRQTNNQDINQIFEFLSKPQSRDFEARTLHIVVTLVEKSMKETFYGEARLPLLTHEIYSQIPTDISIGIRPCPPQNEIGDIQLCMSYHPDQKKLDVMAKTVKFINPSLTENLTSIHIKAHLMEIGGVKLGKKRGLSKSLSSIKSNQSIEFQDYMSFKLDLEHFLLCTLKLNLHGKHRILGKHLSLGKIRIGESHRDEGGKVHWRILLNSDAIGWTMWHPIYSS